MSKSKREKKEEQLRLKRAASTVSPSQGVLAQLVRAPPCHGGGCGFEPRRLRIVSFVQRDAVDHCDLGLPCIRAASNDHCPAPTISRKSRPSHIEKSVRASCIHAPKTISRQLHQRKSPETVTQKDGNFGCNNCHSDGHQHHNRCESG